jgi:DNA-binding HxlR family transcriptional regulator
MPPVSERTAVLHAVPPAREPTDWEMVDGTRLVVGLLSGRWSIGVLYLLADGTKRFTEVYYEVGEVSKKALTQTLRGLERDGLVTRTIFPTIPPRVDYELTDLGRGLSKPVEALGKWAFDHRTEIEAARARFDGRNQN